MAKLMSKEELEKRTDLEQTDRELIERIIGEMVGSDSVKVRALRAYLVGEMEDCVIDDTLRSELPIDAAAFSDGWEAASKYFHKK